MDRGAKGWLVTTAKQNLWRVEDTFSFDDLLQDGHSVYWRIVRRYPNVKAPKQIMALFKTAFTNHLHDLAKRRTRRSFVSRESEHDVPLSDMRSITHQPPDVVIGAPPLLHALVRAIEERPQRMRAAFRQRRGGQRETTNERICSMLGITDPGFDIMASLHEYLLSAEARTT